MGWLPGTDVTGSQPELIARLHERVTRPGYTPLQAMYLSRRVGKEFLHSSFFAVERFLLYYVRHDCPRLNRLHIVYREELVAFLDSRIRPELREGADFIVTTFEMVEFLLTIHDGDLFHRLPTEWPAADQEQV